jgi:hypothetical protein
MNKEQILIAPLQICIRNKLMWKPIIYIKSQRIYMENAIWSGPAHFCICFFHTK